MMKLHSCFMLIASWALLFVLSLILWLSVTYFDQKDAIWWLIWCFQMPLYFMVKWKFEFEIMDLGRIFRPKWYPMMVDVILPKRTIFWDRVKVEFHCSFQFHGWNCMISYFDQTTSHALIDLNLRNWANFDSVSPANMLIKELLMLLLRMFCR